MNDDDVMSSLSSFYASSNSDSQFQTPRHISPDDVCVRVDTSQRQCQQNARVTSTPSKSRNNSSS